MNTAPKTFPAALEDRADPPWWAAFLTWTSRPPPAERVRPSGLEAAQTQRP